MQRFAGISRKILRVWRNEGAMGLLARILHRKSARHAFGGTPEFAGPMRLRGALSPGLADMLAVPPLCDFFLSDADQAGPLFWVDPAAEAVAAAGCDCAALCFTALGRLRDFLAAGRDVTGAALASAVLLVATEACVAAAAEAGFPPGRVFHLPSQEGPDAFRAGLIRWLIAAGAIAPELTPPGIRAEWFPGLGGLQPDARLCLSLPEAVERRRRFRSLGLTDFTLFPGLRYSPAWQGAAMSYALMARAAMAQGAVPLTICEDDLIPGADFRTRLASVHSYLQENPGWDVFSGLLTNLAEGTRVTRVVRQEGQMLIHLDFTTGMVFNIYNARALEHLSRWQRSGGDVAVNTIDDWLGQLPGLQVVTSLPFLVGHDSGQRSTIFGFSNQRYDRVIEASARRLARLVEEFEAKEAAARF
ncbi:hypothetical protein HOY34_05350 [Xinfangfangia sp. D13-10-4-6]|uniref:hypothetical protein n=1 Tax=Pseudogemmobacter hezensis TaxID=2737662 RepID=UPI001551B662|nr:hypothetical protein [Pseudogemmobacter hezensis]NPD14628.1 hypothetical protein [Pseudogemmobacter hezensis]